MSLPCTGGDADELSLLTIRLDQVACARGRSACEHAALDTGTDFLAGVWVVDSERRKEEHGGQECVSWAEKMEKREREREPDPEDEQRCWHSLGCASPRNVPRVAVSLLCFVKCRARLI